jgi:gliding motility-associated-like protein
MNKDTDDVWVEVAVSPVANAGPEFWDQIDTVTLNGSQSLGVGPLTYLWWQYDNKNQVVPLDTTVTIQVDRSGDYYLTITDRFGCTNTDETHVGYKYNPFIAVDDYIETPQQEPTVCIKVLRNDSIDPDDSYILSLLMVTQQPKHGTIVETPFDSCFTYTPEPYFIGNDTFTYIVSTAQGYSDEAIVVIKVLPRPAIVPEGFSPNGDGINDVLIIENIEKYELNSIVIFNRWGNVVYKKTKYSNSEPWDGVANKGIRIGHGPVPAGVYLYILDLGDDRVNREINGIKVNNRIVKGNIYVASDKQ